MTRRTPGDHNAAGAAELLDQIADDTELMFRAIFRGPDQAPKIRISLPPPPPPPADPAKRARRKAQRKARKASRR